MKAKNAIICWTADRASVAHGKTRGEVTVYDHVACLAAGQRPWRAFQSASGHCDEEWRKASDLRRAMLMFIHFNTLTVRDGLDPQKVHGAFLKIEEYRQRIAPDVMEADVAKE
jgi:hypothetical protein